MGIPVIFGRFFNFPRENILPFVKVDYICVSFLTQTNTIMRNTMETIRVEINTFNASGVCEKTEFTIESTTDDKTLQKLHNTFSEDNPDSFVHFYWGEGSFILGIKWNSKIAEELYNAGKISWEEYCNRTK